MPTSIVADIHDNIWVRNNQGLIEIPKGGTPGNPNYQIFTGFNYPRGIATDAHGNVWVANYAQV